MTERKRIVAPRTMWKNSEKREGSPTCCVCRKPRALELVKESRNVGHGGRAALLPFELVVSPFRPINAAW
jgi:hypothetical protein